MLSRSSWAGFAGLALILGLIPSPPHAPRPLSERETIITTAHDGTPGKQRSGAQKLTGDFAPRLVELTDDVLFGDVWPDPSWPGGIAG